MAGHWRFSSKRLGLRILRSAVRGTDGRTLWHKEVTGKGDIGKNVRGRGHTILVRSDQLRLHEKVGDAERRKQPRRHFPNTPEGRKNARGFIKTHLRGYSLFVQHLSRPREAVQWHGRIFIRPNGTVWFYLASPVPHAAFAKWPHKRIAKYNLLVEPGKTGAKKRGLDEKAFKACKAIVGGVFEQMKTMKSTDISRMAFVVYKDSPNNPEFYDLLFIQGMKKPSARIF